MTFAAWWAGQYRQNKRISARNFDLLRQAYTAGRNDEVESSEKPPVVLFDGYAVLCALTDDAKKRTSAENVSDVLDAVVRIMRSNASFSREPERSGGESAGSDCWARLPGKE